LAKLEPGEGSEHCDRCGEPADQPLYKGGICAPCYDELAERVAAHTALRGHGRRVEPCQLAAAIRARFPSQYCMLRCTSCSSTWYGPRGESCSGCAADLDRMQRHQAQVLLTPELPDVDDARYDGAVRAWGERLARAVEAELISEQTALAAWRKAVGDERAA